MKYKCEPILVLYVPLVTSYELRLSDSEVMPYFYAKTALSSAHFELLVAGPGEASYATTQVVIFCVQRCLYTL